MPTEVRVALVLLLVTASALLVFVEYACSPPGAGG
jgi:hypothetical protein